MSSGKKFSDRNVSFSPNLIGSIFFIALSIFFLLTMEREVYIGSDEGVNARTFPSIVLWIMLSLSLFTFIREMVFIFMKKERRKKDLNLGKEARALLLFLVMFLYVTFIPLLGFFLSSIIFSVILAYCLGARRISYFLIVASSSLAICLIFRYLLDVRL